MDEQRNLRRILIVRTDRLGDMVLTLPLIQEIARQLPEASIDVMCRRYTAPLLERHPTVSGIISVDNARRGGWRAVVRKIRTGTYDAAVVVHPTVKDTLAVLAAGVPIRVGNGYRWYSFLHNRPVFFHRSEAKRHELEYNLLYLKSLRLEYPKYAPSPYVPLLDSDVSSARELLGGLADDYVVIHPGSGGSSLNWPTAYYSELAARLTKEKVRTIVTTGGREETPTAEEVARAAGGLSVAGRTDFGTLLGVLSGAALFISGNTGPMHLAAALGRPVVALFSPLKSGSPARWRPVGGPSRVLLPPGYECDKCPVTKCPDYNCIERLTVDEVLEAAETLLKETKKRVSDQ